MRANKKDIKELEDIMAEVSLTNETLAHRIKNGLYKKIIAKTKMQEDTLRRHRETKKILEQHKRNKNGSKDN